MQQAHIDASRETVFDIAFRFRAARTLNSIAFWRPSLTAKRNPLATLHDILEEVEEIREKLDGLDREEFLHDRKTQRAARMCFVTLGNAFHDLKITSPKLAGRFSELDDNVDLRNVLAHECRSAKPATVWKVARDRLPDLEQSVAYLISELDPEGRHTLESLYAQSDERADRDLQLASVLTARVYPCDRPVSLGSGRGVDPPL